MEDMSNPQQSIGEALTQSVYTINQQRNTGYIYETSGSFWECAKVCCKANVAMPTPNYSSTGHADDFPVTVSTYSGRRPTHAVVDTDGPSYIEYYVRCICGQVCMCRFMYIVCVRGAWHACLH